MVTRDCDQCRDLVHCGFVNFAEADGDVGPTGMESKRRRHGGAGVRGWIARATVNGGSNSAAQNFA